MKLEPTQRKNKAVEEIIAELSALLKLKLMAKINEVDTPRT